MPNPMDAMKAISLFRQFQGRHPKLVKFFQNEIMTGAPEGSVFEISMTKPGEETVTTNLRVTREDLELIEELKKMR